MLLKASLFLIAAAAMPAHAAVLLTAPGFSEDFDTLANSGTSIVLPQGWSIFETGTNANGSYTAGTGSSLTGNTYSFGAAGSSERALGGVASRTLIPSYGVQITNGLSSTVTALDISYFGELWRVGTSGNTNTLSFAYSLDATSLGTGSYTDFTSLDFAVTPGGPTGFRDGNTGRSFISATLTGLSVAQGESIFLRWSHADEAGNDHGLAIDDFSLNAATGAIPEPASWAMLIAGFGLVGNAARRRRARQPSVIV